jgi:hypothetical protein
MGLHHQNEVRCVDIVVPPRHRKDMGDLHKLADSISRLDLMQPIGVTAENVLIWGERRLRAVRDILKLETIAALVVDMPALEAEHDENEVRKDFTVSERVAIAERLQSQWGNRQGLRTDMADLPAKRPEAQPAAGEESREAAARIAGLGSAATLRRAQAVVANGTPELIEAMDKDEVSVTGAAQVAELPKKKQRQAVKEIKAGASPKAAVAEAKKAAPAATDALGRTLPDGLKDVFADPALAEAEELLRGWSKTIHPPSVVRPLAARFTAYRYLLLGNLEKALHQVEEALDEAIEIVANARPYAVCPACDGHACDDCRHSGYVPAWALKGAEA